MFLSLHLELRALSAFPNTGAEMKNSTPLYCLVVLSANTKVGKIPGCVHEVSFKCYEGSQVKTDFLVTLECMGWMLLHIGTWI